MSFIFFMGKMNYYMCLFICFIGFLWGLNESVYENGFLNYEMV